jgi:hypothetical protein
MSVADLMHAARLVQARRENMRRERKVVPFQSPKIRYASPK